MALNDLNIGEENTEENLPVSTGTGGFNGELPSNMFGDSPAEFLPLDDVAPNMFDFLNEQSAVELGNPEAARRATPVRTATAALSELAEQPARGSLPETVQQLIELRQQVEGMIESGQERQIAMRAASRQMLNRDRALRQLRPQAEVDPQLMQAIDTAIDENVHQEAAARAEHALVQETIRVIEERLVAGDEVGARVLIRQYDPVKGTTRGLMRDHLERQLIMQRAIEQAGLDEENESWINTFVTSVLSIPEAILFGESFQRLGNVDEGVGGYRRRWHRFFTPGSEMANQIEAIQGLNAQELADYMPTLIANLRGNSSYALGLRDEGRVLGLLSQFRDSLSPEDQLLTNIFATVDVASFVPVTRIGRMTNAIAALGARNSAARNVQQAVAETVESGADVARRTTTMTVDEIEDNTLPSIINPHVLPENPQVSLSGQVSEAFDEADMITRQITAGPTSSRFVGRELDDAFEAAQVRLQERTGTVVHDVQRETRRLADGTETYRISAVVGPENGFATEAEAVGWATSRGIYSDVTQVEGRQIVKETRTTPRDEGYDLPAYHGTNREIFGDLRESPTGMLGRGVYLSQDSKLASDVYASGFPSERLNPQVIPVLVKRDKIFGADLVRTGWAPNDVAKGLKELGINRRSFNNWLSKGGERLTDETMNSELFFNRVTNFFRQTKFADQGASKAEIAAIEHVNETLRRKGWHGRAQLVSGDDEMLLFEAGNARSALEAHVVRDVSDRFFVKADMDVAETGIWATPLEAPETSILSRIPYSNNVLSSSQLLDRNMFGKSLEAGNRRNKYMRAAQDMSKAWNALRSTERNYMRAILTKGEELSQWFNREQFDVIWERATGRAAPERAYEAYYKFQTFNDVEYILRNANVYRQKVIQGYESVRFTTHGQQHDIDAIIKETPTVRPDERVYNLSDDVHHTRGDNMLTTERLREYREGGYVLFRTEHPIKLGDGVETNQFLAKRADIEMRPLRDIQLQYKAGGHRLYADRYFVKQASRGVQPDTGSPFLRNPNVYVTAPTPAKAREWADTMNRALRAVNEGKTAQFLDENIFRARNGYPTGEKFIDDIENGRIGKEDEFEVTYDREQPSAYKQSNDMANFIDEDEVGFNGFYRTNGRMYYSPKGDKLMRFDGEAAPVIDPFEAQMKSIYNVTNMSSFADFKVTAMERWVRSFENDLVMPRGTDSYIEKFNQAQVERSVSAGRKQMIEGQRESIARILNFETEFDRTRRSWSRRMSEWVYGDSTSPLREKLGDFAFNTLERNPTRFIHGLAFDMKLGLFNIGQFFIQTSTMASALSMSTRHGLKGVGSVFPMNAFLLSKGNPEGTLHKLTEMGMHRIAGFDDVDEFKAYARYARQSGFFDLGDTHVLVNAYGPNAAFGGARGGVKAIRETGRFFFYQAEVANRLTAFRIAYGEAVENFGKRGFDDPEFREFMARRAEAYSFNMSQESKAMWQNGLLSIPTQFWAYQVRMIEALLGSNFTAAQKVRLLFAQMVMAGTAGVPIVAGVMEWRNHQDGHAPTLGTMSGILQRGAFDNLINEMFGVDIAVSERWGTGSWSTDLIRDIFGYSQYGTRPFAEIIGGASYSIMSDTLAAAWQVGTFWSTHEAGNEQVSLRQDQIGDFLRNISTYSNVTKALIAYNYGMFRTNQGEYQLRNLPSESAFFIALGFRPGQAHDIEAMRAYGENRRETIQELSTEMNRLLQEGMLRPDLFEENAQKVNLLSRLIPADLRREVLQRVHASRDPTTYERLLRQRRTQDIVADIIEDNTEQQEQSVSVPTEEVQQ